MANRADKRSGQCDVATHSTLTRACTLVPALLNVLQYQIRHGAGLILRRNSARIAHPGFETRVLGMKTQVGFDFGVVAYGVPRPTFVARRRDVRVIDDAKGNTSLLQRFGQRHKILHRLVFPIEIGVNIREFLPGGLAVRRRPRSRVDLALRKLIEKLKSEGGLAEAPSG